ncbi:MAG: sarcosine oxidase subunit delta [Kiloniellaceae bacterium]
MLLIPCPYCGPRSESEFSYGDQAHIARPPAPDAISDDAWAGYVFLRDNTKGVFLERWVHTHGCRRWFNVARNTVSYEILAVYEANAAPPAIAQTSEI